MTHFDDAAAVPAIANETRPLYWSVRRELWENRSVYLAPLIVAAVVLFGTFVSTVATARGMRGTDAATPGKRVVMPYSMAPAPIMLTTLLVGFFYCADALYSERRDRSILFWKSVPVSDRTTVLSKVLIPMVVLPTTAIVLSLIVQFAVLLLTAPILLASGVRPFTAYGIEDPIIMVYGLGAHVLWFSPVYAWLLLVSAWARRTPLLWAVLAPLAVVMFERIVFGTNLFVHMLQERFTGAMKHAFAGDEAQQGNVTRLSELSLLNYLSTPGLWIGLAFAAACLFAATRLRRRREPI